MTDDARRCTLPAARSRPAVQTRPVTPGAPQDELASGAPTWGKRWTGASSQARHRLQSAAVGACGLAVLGAGVQSRAELVDRHEVTLTAALLVTASSSSTDGGRVEHAVSLRNDSPHTLRLQTGSLALPGLRGAVRAGLPTDVAPGEQVPLALTLRLDCTARAGARDDRLRLTVAADPRSGRRRQLRIPVAAGDPLLAQISTLCRARPDLVDVELSGPGARPP